MPLATFLAVLLNIKTFGGAILILLALLIAVSLFYRHPKRKCHRCGNMVRLDQRICRSCGYDFEPARTTR